MGKNEHIKKIVKKRGRSSGILVKDPILGDTISEKMYASRKNNNPKRYAKLKYITH